MESIVVSSNCLLWSVKRSLLDAAAVCLCVCLLVSDRCPTAGHRQRLVPSSRLGSEIWWWVPVSCHHGSTGTRSDQNARQVWSTLNYSYYLLLFMLAVWLCGNVLASRRVEWVLGSWMCDRLSAGKPSCYIIRHPYELSLAIPGSKHCAVF